MGLGDGLTPSGDDFLGGLLFGLAAIMPDDQGHPDPSSLNLREFLESGSPAYE